MADPGAPERPRQVTFAGILAVVGCLLLVVALFDAMALVRSAEMRDDVASFLAEPPGDGLGLTVDGALRLLHAVVLLTGALAAAGAVLGIYAMQRHRGARIGLSIVAGLLLLLSMSSLVGILPALVAAAATLLWGRESRAWFDGRVLEPATDTPSGGSVQRSGGTGEGGNSGRPDPFARPAPPSAQQLATWAPPAPGDRVDEVAAEQPRADERSAEPAPAPAPGPLPGPQPVAQAGPPTVRPRTVTVALLLTLVLSGLTALVLAGSMVRALTDKDGVFRQLQSANPDGVLGGTPNEVLRLVLVVQVVGILWCLLAIGLALAARRRVDAARVALVVCSLAAMLVSLVGLVAAFPVPLPHVVATVAVAVLLLTPRSNAWFARRDRHRPPPSGGAHAWPPPQQSHHPQNQQGKGPKPPVW